MKPPTKKIANTSKISIITAKYLKKAIKFFHAAKIIIFEQNDAKR